MQPSQTLPRTDFSTLRLLYPQWQGGDVASWFKDLSPKEAAQGYVLGAEILTALQDYSLNQNKSCYWNLKSLTLTIIKKNPIMILLMIRDSLLQIKKKSLAFVPTFINQLKR